MVTAAPDETWTESHDGGAIREASHLPDDRRWRYTLIRELGRGGMGSVFAAHDRRLLRIVALKLVRAKMTPARRARLLAEGRALAALSDPHVVAVYDVGTRGDEPFLAMELVEGMTLGAWLEVRDRTVGEILAVFGQAALGLAAAHRLGIVHRDVKPSNVMVGSDGRVRIVDFGLAIERVDPTGRDPAHDPDGTRKFMAPEQRAGGPIDARADQYSFCVSLHWALWRAAPGETPRHRPRVPMRVERAIARGLHEDARRRWDSMEELRDALMPPRRRALAVVLAFVFVTTTAGGLATYSFAGGRGEDPEIIARAASTNVASGHADVVSVREGLALAQDLVDAGKHDEGESGLRDAFAKAWTQDAFDVAAEAATALVYVLGVTRTRHEESLEWARQAEAMIEAGQLDGHARAALDGNLGLALQTHGELTPALAHLERALAYWQSSDPGQPVEEADALMRVAVVEDQLDRRSEAEEHLRQALALKTEAVGPDDPSLAALLINLGILTRRHGESGEAEALLGRALHLQTSALGTEHPDLSPTLAALAGLYLATDRPDEALDHFVRARDIAQTALGDDHARVATYLDGIASVHWRLGAFEDAIAAYHRALTIKSAAFGPDHPAVADALGNLGFAMVRSGRADAAIPYLEQALAIRRDTLGPSHHNVTWTLLQLAAAYREGGDVERARGLYERVIALSHERGTILQHADAATDALTEIEASSPAGAP